MEGKSTLYNWENLGNAVVETAADDYRSALITGNPVMRRECESFFCSEYIRRFTSLDGRVIMNKIREEFDLA